MANTNRAATLNTDTNEIKTTLESVTQESFEILQHIADGYIIFDVDDVISDLIKVVVGGKIGKSNIKISAPVEIFELAFKLTPLVKQIEQKYMQLYNLTPKQADKKIRIRRNDAISTD
jgi:hypothetical protein